MSGDEKLKLYLAHRSALIHYATPLTGSRAAAEDVVQDAWFRFAEAAAPAHSVSYLYRIVRNLALDLVRRLNLESRHQPQEADEEILYEWMAPAMLPEPERTLSNVEQLHHVAEAVAALPETARRALEMYRLGGMRLKEIAAALNVPISTVQRLVQHSMVKVALHLDAVNQTGSEPPGPLRDNKKN